MIDDDAGMVIVFSFLWYTGTAVRDKVFYMRTR